MRSKGVDVLGGEAGNLRCGWFGSGLKVNVVINDPEGWDTRWEFVGEYIGELVDHRLGGVGGGDFPHRGPAFGVVDHVCCDWWRSVEFGFPSSGGADAIKLAEDFFLFLGGDDNLRDVGGCGRCGLLER